MFAKRLGLGPIESGAQCFRTSGCPNIWELEDGDFAVIGTDITMAAIAQLPPTAGCASDERIIRLPRRLLISAKRDIPDRM